jgi:hypothetical protein
LPGSETALHGFFSSGYGLGCILKNPPAVFACPQLHHIIRDGHLSTGSILSHFTEPQAEVLFFSSE